MNLKEAGDIARDEWSINASRYPEIKNFNDSERRIFEIRHRVKSLQVILEKFGEIEYWESHDRANAREMTKLILLGTVHLAKISGVSVQQFIRNGGVNHPQPS